MSHPVMHFEIAGKDRPALNAYYAKLFGWEIHDEAAMNYSMISGQEGGISGGIGDANGGPGHVTFYVGADDIQATLDKAVELGGSVVMPVTELPMVTIALFADIEGHVIGLVKGM